MGLLDQILDQEFGGSSAIDAIVDQEFGQDMPSPGGGGGGGMLGDYLRQNIAAPAAGAAVYSQQMNLQRGLEAGARAGRDYAFINPSQMTSDQMADRVRAGLPSDIFPTSALHAAAEGEQPNPFYGQNKYSPSMYSGDFMWQAGGGRNRPGPAAVILPDGTYAVDRQLMREHIQPWLAQPDYGLSEGERIGLTVANRAITPLANSPLFQPVARAALPGETDIERSLTGIYTTLEETAQPRSAVGQLAGDLAQTGRGIGLGLASGGPLGFVGAAGYGTFADRFQELLPEVYAGRMTREQAMDQAKIAGSVAAAAASAEGPIERVLGGMGVTRGFAREGISEGLTSGPSYAAEQLATGRPVDPGELFKQTVGGVALGAAAGGAFDAPGAVRNFLRRQTGPESTVGQYQNIKQGTAEAPQRQEFAQFLRSVLEGHGGSVPDQQLADAYMGAFLATQSNLPTEGTYLKPGDVPLQNQRTYFPEGSILPPKVVQDFEADRAPRPPKPGGGVSRQAYPPGYEGPVQPSERAPYEPLEGRGPTERYQTRDDLRTAWRDVMEDGGPEPEDDHEVFKQQATQFLEQRLAQAQQERRPQDAAALSKALQAVYRRQQRKPKAPPAQPPSQPPPTQQQRPSELEMTQEEIDSALEFGRRLDTLKPSRGVPVQDLDVPLTFRREEAPTLLPPKGMPAARRQRNLAEATKALASVEEFHRRSGLPAKFSIVDDAALDDEQQAMVRAAKRMGVDVFYMKADEGQALVGGLAVKGTEAVVLNALGDKSPAGKAYIIGHEIKHVLDKVAPDAYRAWTKTLSNEDLQAAWKAYQNRFVTSAGQTDAAKAYIREKEQKDGGWLDEAEAVILGHAFQHPEVFRKFAQQEPGLWVRFKEALQKFLRLFRGGLNDRSHELNQHLKLIEDTVAEVDAKESAPPTLPEPDVQPDAPPTTETDPFAKARAKKKMKKLREREQLPVETQVEDPTDTTEFENLRTRMPQGVGPGGNVSIPDGSKVQVAALYDKAVRGKLSLPERAFLRNPSANHDWLQRAVFQKDPDAHTLLVASVLPKVRSLSRSSRGAHMAQLAAQERGERTDDVISAAAETVTDWIAQARKKGQLAPSYDPNKSFVDNVFRHLKTEVKRDLGITKEQIEGRQKREHVLRRIKRTHEEISEAKARDDFKEVDRLERVAKGLVERADKEGAGARDEAAAKAESFKNLDPIDKAALARRLQTIGVYLTTKHGIVSVTGGGQQAKHKVKLSSNPRQPSLWRTPAGDRVEVYVTRHKNGKVLDVYVRDLGNKSKQPITVAEIEHLHEGAVATTEPWVKLESPLRTQEQVDPQDVAGVGGKVQKRSRRVLQTRELTGRQFQAQRGKAPQVSGQTGFETADKPHQVMAVQKLPTSPKQGSLPNYQAGRLVEQRLNVTKAQVLDAAQKGELLAPLEQIQRVFDEFGQRPPRKLAFSPTGRGEMRFESSNWDGDSGQFKIYEDGELLGYVELERGPAEPDGRSAFVHRMEALHGPKSIGTDALKHIVSLAKEKLGVQKIHFFRGGSTGGPPRYVSFSPPGDVTDIQGPADTGKPKPGTIAHEMTMFPHKVTGEPPDTQDMGRPDLSSRAKTPAGRSLKHYADMVRDAAGEPDRQTHEQWEREAQQKYKELGFDDSIAYLQKKRLKFDAKDQKLSALLLDEAGKRLNDALGSGKPMDEIGDVIAQAWVVAGMDSEAGTLSGRALASRVDPNMTPAQRLQRYVKNAVLWPDKSTAQDLLAFRSQLAATYAYMQKRGIDLHAVLKPGFKDEVALAQALREAETLRATFADKAFEYYVSAGLLSGVSTQIANTFGNVGYGGWGMTVKRLTEMLVNQMPGFNTPDAAQLGEAKHMLRGWLAGMPMAFANAVKVWRTEMPVMSGPDRIGGHRPAIKGVKGRVIRMPVRALATGDEFVQTWNAYMQAYAVAYRTAKEAVRQLKIPDAKTRQQVIEKSIAEQVADPESDAWRQGRAWAAHYAFKGQGGPFTKKLASFRQLPLMRYVIPFVETPLRIFEVGLKEFTPLGTPRLAYKMAKRGFISMRRGKEAGELYYKARDRVTDVAEQVLAWGLFALMGSLFDRGLITGTAGKGAEREHKYGTAPPYSARVFGTWRSYTRLEPWATQMAALVSFFENVEKGEKMSFGSQIALALQHSKELVRDKTFLKGVGDLIRATEEGEFSTAWASNFAANWMPNLFRQSMRASDLTVREWRQDPDKSWASKMGSSTFRKMFPLGRFQGEPRFDSWGSPVTKPKLADHPATDWLLRMVSPWQNYETAPTGVKLNHLITRYNAEHPDEPYYINRPPRSVRMPNGQTIGLSEQEYALRVRLLGRISYRAAKPLVEDVDLMAADEADIERRVGRLRAIRSQVQERVTRQIMRLAYLRDRNQAEMYNDLYKQLVGVADRLDEQSPRETEP